MRPTRGDKFDLATPSVTKSVLALHDAAAAATVWTPATGKRVVVTGFQLQVVVNVSLQNAAAGDYVLLYDNVVTAPIAVLGVSLVATPIAGSLLHTGAQSVTGTAFVPATGTSAQAGILMAPSISLFHRTSAADNVVKVAMLVAATGAIRDVGTGELRIMGTIWGHEENY